MNVRPGEMLTCLLAAAIRGAPPKRQGKGGPGKETQLDCQSLQRNQCAYWKEIGQWKNKCPQLKRKQGDSKQEAPDKEEGALLNLAEGLLGSSVPKEPLVRMTVGGRDIDFLVDSGAEHSLVTAPVAPLSKKTIDIIGATGVSAKQASCLPRTCTVGGHKVIHQFWYMPDCPLPLLGRDLLSKLRATICLTEHGSFLLKLPGTGVIMTLMVPQEKEWRLFLTEPGQERRPALSKLWPRVWAEDNPLGLAVNQAPVLIEVKPGAQLVRQKQDPVPREALQGIQVRLKHLRTFGIIVPCQSPWNTPLLPVPKPQTKDYRPVQD
ncbi:uncharacterized protein LOC129397271 [Pan paniscus]|uniref:uncharacterized protein LOC129397271 n=1 Tax=Pan paniscus TaxID=9597 RepID=UPI002436B3CA|nr:uncharacterized protein LOC129397271 [Pan paniscus]XP_054964585.1 uncharacterized protein LOC129397271 [Pan paniscus]XP_054964586.1 uncharacterized protein LOC129397271 [Pan paniscus]